MIQPILALGAVGLAIALVPPTSPVAPQGTDLTIPHTFQGGDPALASEVNDNFQAVRTHSNGLSASIKALEDRLPSSQNLVTVAPVGGDFSSVSSALAAAGATAAQIAERVAVVVLPGTYAELATVTVPGGVTLLGSNRTTTILRVEASPAIELEDAGQIMCISVQNTLIAEAVIGIRAVSVGPDSKIEDVRVLPPDPATFITGIGLYDSILTVRRAEVLDEDTFGIGVQVGGSSDAVTRVAVEDSEIRVNPFGLDAFLDCEVVVRRTQFRSTTPIFAHFDGTFVFVEGCELTSTDASSIATVSQSAQLRLATSQLAGDVPVVTTGGTVRVVHCYAADFRALANGDT